MSITTDTIRKRKSVRTFEDREIDQKTLDQLQAYLDDIDDPYHIHVSFKLLDAARDGVSSPVIVNGKKYVGAKVKRQPHAEEAFGYSFEKFVLFAETLGLGTVWLAATIDRSAFEKAMDLESDEVMPAVSPVGYKARKRSVREYMMRKGMKSDNRLPFEELFFQGDFSTPLTEDEAGRWQTPLEMARIAPSATNKQPWRLVVDGDKVHFYEKKTKGYDRESTGDIQKVDLGIAMCHFEIAAKEQGDDGAFKIEEPEIAVPEGTEYIITYQMEK